MTDSRPLSQERLPTGVPGLDTVLRGGLVRGSAYMVMGMPGAGKTILANQVCFHHAAHGGRVLYVTLLAESHARLLSNLSTLTFFDAARIPEAVAYLSAYSVLEEGGLEALLELLRREMKAQQATLLVLDGLVAAEEVAPSPQAVKKFIHGLQVVTGFVGCTTLLLTTSNGKGLAAEHTMVDGLLILRERTFGVRPKRELCVRKSRGSPSLRGYHGFDITARGVEVYPRLETLVEDTPPLRAARLGERKGFGIPGLDKMLQGGVIPGSTTMLLGSSGSGKTIFGLHFLAEGARRGERSHYFAFYDSPERMLAQAEGVGLELEPLMKRGDFEVSFRPPTENVLDQIGVQLLALIRERGVKRLFLDGFDALSNAAFHPRRTARFLAALINECRARGVTLLHTVELVPAFGSELVFPMKGISMVAENILLLRSVELNAELRRFISILKVRNGGYDHTFREIHISDRGVEVGRPLKDGQKLLTGLARSATAPRRRLLKRRSP